MEVKPAYGIDELAEAGPHSRASLYRLIKAGELVAQKAGRRTIITHENWLAYLRSRPVIGRADAANNAV
ncbi:helix-turn-helix domain-containing protein [Bradyrhizobium sp. USDA 4471]